MALRLDTLARRLLAAWPSFCELQPLKVAIAQSVIESQSALFINQKLPIAWRLVTRDAGCR
jgi:hypothetical protein